MSPDEAFLVQLLSALSSVHLEYMIVGSAAAALQGAPVMTQDVDLLVRDTPINRERIERLAGLLGAARPVPVSELTTTISLVGGDVPVDILFDRLPGNLSFESLRSRSVSIALGEQSAIVASLADIIGSKEASGRPKDLALLPILRDTQRIREALGRGE